MTAPAVSALLSCEHEENNTLIEILSLIKSSRASQKDAKLASLVRGLCTHNSSLLNMIKSYLNTSQDDDMDAFKQLVNNFINWFDGAYVVFDKYFSCFPLDYDYAVMGKPILHLACYSAFIDSAMYVLRNPFVIERLSVYKAKVTSLLSNYAAHCEMCKLNDISFENVVSLAGDKVSASFSLNDIVVRTENKPVFMGSHPVELVLLKLPNAHADFSEYNALALLRMPPKNSSAPRSLMHPPFRLNEVNIKECDKGMIVSSICYFDKANPISFVLSSTVPGLMTEWYAKLTRIFPSPQSAKVAGPPQLFSLEGLGITCLNSEESAEDTDESPLYKNSDPSFTPLSAFSSETVLGKTPPRRSSVHLMRKAFDDNGVNQAEEVSKTLNLISNSQPHHSVKAEYDYADDVESCMGSDESLSCFEAVNKPARRQGNIPTAKSLPELSESKPQHQVYTTAAGSAINISEFGKNHNPSFCSEHVLDGPTGKAGGLQKRKSIFNIFKRNKSKDNIQKADKKKEVPAAKQSQPEQPRKSSQPEKDVSAKQPQKQPQQQPQKQLQQQLQKQLQKLQPELQKQLPMELLPLPLVPLVLAQLPKTAMPKDNGELNLKKHTLADRLDPPPALNLSENGMKSRVASTGSIPSSGTTGSFPRTLPLPFALPSSTSTYFFKPYAQNSDSVSGSANNSSTSVASLGLREDEIAIPQELKQTINSSESIDFYISPTSPQSLKVSKWKQKYGKWEMLTTNERLFIKIVANYTVHKSWLLAFKEEFDEEEKELVDKPLLIMDLNGNTSVRQSSAVDLEVKSVNSISGERSLVIMRCLKEDLLNAVQGNLDNIIGVMGAKQQHQNRAMSGFESSSTLTSSLMSKPSQTSTVASVSINDGRLAKQQLDEAGLETVLLDRFTVKLHRQMEGYSKIHQLSSWKTHGMFTMQIQHSVDSVERGMFLMKFEGLDEDYKGAGFAWALDDTEIGERTERIGKAGMLVQVKDEEIYMVECKGKKELKRLRGLLK